MRKSTIGTSGLDQSTSPGEPQERHASVDAGVARAQFKHARIAENHQARGVGQAPVGEHARALLGADAGGIAEHQAQQRRAALKQASGR